MKLIWFLPILGFAMGPQIKTSADFLSTKFCKDLGCSIEDSYPHRDGGTILNYKVVKGKVGFSLSGVEKSGKLVILSISFNSFEGGVDQKMVEDFFASMLSGRPDKKSLESIIENAKVVVGRNDSVPKKGRKFKIGNLSGRSGASGNQQIIVVNF